MAIDLNADVGKILKDWLSGKKSSSGQSTSGQASPVKQLKKDIALKSIIVICVLVSAIYGVGLLTENPIEKDKSEFTDNEKLNNALAKLNKDIRSSKRIFKNNQQSVEEILPEFSDAGDSKNLFKLISNLANDNNLIIKNISKGVTNQVNNPIRYIQNTVFLEIEGFYPNFISFKEQLSINKTILGVLNEKIKLKKDKYGDRTLNINLVISDFSIEKGSYETLLSKKH